ncbi:hypothetical protein AVEN_213475-1 [Araneus ventricosus]|uniref:Uncharacterized protein n=1 Tax=Araneus ventricosus TaxID=182803 RepID=A0A4Y2TJL7_ARAVE|nr:hypothetical protein AVEN_213475-1 [Araneus ventricosus]
MESAFIVEFEHNFVPNREDQDNSCIFWNLHFVSKVVKFVAKLPKPSPRSSIIDPMSRLEKTLSFPSPFFSRSFPTGYAPVNSEFLEIRELASDQWHELGILVKGCLALLGESGFGCEE